MIIVNFSTDVYKRPQNRLKQSLEGHKTLMFTKYDEIGSPTHQESPYEFKLHAIEKAFEQDDIVLWADSSMYLRGDLSKIEEIIKRDGFFGEECGHYAGRWTNEHTRKYFKVTEQEMHQGLGGITMFSAGLLGINLKNEKAMQFFYEWKASAKAGCFSGSWLDHRHDMSTASIITTRLGFQYQRGGTFLCYVGPGYSPPSETAVFLCQGMA